MSHVSQLKNMQRTAEQIIAILQSGIASNPEVEIEVENFVSALANTTTQGSTISTEIMNALSTGNFSAIPQIVLNFVNGLEPLIQMATELESTGATFFVNLRVANPNLEELVNSLVQNLISFINMGQGI